MLDSVTGADFQALEQQSFSLKHADHAETSAVLSEVKLHSPQDQSPRQPFSLVFTCPSDQAPNQGMYQLDHEQLGSLTLFLVPIGKDDNGVHFEAVFN